MSLQSVAEKLLRSLSSQARSFEQGVQRVVEVISPGPLGAKADSWDAHRRRRAAQAVRAAIKRWEDQSKGDRGGNQR